MKKPRRSTRSARPPRSGPDGFEPGSTVARQASDDVSATFAPASYNASARTVEAIFSTGARVARWGVFEELAITADAIDLRRVPLGQVRLLDTHDQYSVDSILGVVENARIEGSQLVGRIRFADTEAGRRAEGMVARGEVTGISVGYRVSTWTLTSIGDEVEVWRADKWELMEVSLVAVPADPNAFVRTTHVSTQEEDMKRNAAPAPAPAPETRTAPAPAPATETRTVPAPAPAPAPETRTAPSGVDAAAVSAAIAAERTRSIDITDIGTRAGMSRADIDAALRDGSTVESFRTRAFNHMADNADRSQIGSVRGSQDETQTRLDAMTQALTVRMGGAASLRNERGAVVEMSEAARQYARHSLADLAVIVLNERSQPRTAAEREDVLRRAFHTTSDFPILFEGVINRVLAARYQLAAPTYREISARRNFHDFRPHDQVRVGDFPMLAPVGEGGKIKFGTFGESKETVAVAPYAIQFAITRQMLVNDNLGGINEVIGSYGQSVAQFEENTFYAMKASNPKLSDGKAIFHADHGNVAQTAAAISDDAVSDGRAAMRKQKSLSGQLLNVMPRILLTTADNETDGDKLIAQVTPTKSSDVNVFSQKLRNVTAPASGTSWELYADPSVLPCFVWGMLDGYEAPRLRIENPFGVSGVGVSLEHDFGCGPVDSRGCYRNAGQ